MFFSVYADRATATGARIHVLNMRHATQDVVQITQPGKCPIDVVHS